MASHRKGSLEDFNIPSPVRERIASIHRRQLQDEGGSWWRDCVQKVRRDLLELNQRNKALFVFEEQNAFRKKAKRIIKSRIFEVFLGLVVILNVIALALFMPEPNLDMVPSNYWITWVVGGTTLCFVVEAVLKIISYGLIFHPKAFLRQYYNIFDVVIICMGFLQFITNIVNNTIDNTMLHLASQICASLTALWLFRLLLRFESPQFILKVLTKSVTPLVHFAMFGMIFIFFFALIGLDVFKGALHKGCFSNFITPDGGLQSYITSSYACSNNSVLSSGAYMCSAGSTCLDWDEGPYYRTLSFDNIFSALNTVFEVLTLEGWTATFYLYEAIFGFAYVWVYFISVALFGFIFVLNLLVGVVASVFQGVSEREEEQGKVRRSKEKQRDDEDIHNYRQWMQKAVEAEEVLHENAGNIPRRPSWLFDIKSILKKDSEISTVEDTQKELKGQSIYSLCCRTFVEAMVQSNPFILTMLGIRLLNILLLMTIHYVPGDPTYMSLLDLTVFIINHIFSVIYIIECCLKLYGLGYRKYFKTYMNMLDFACTVLNILDLLIYIPVAYSLKGSMLMRSISISVMVNAMRCLGLLRILKYTKYWKSVKKIGRILSDVFELTLTVMAIILIIDFVYALIGVRLFGGLVHIDSFVIPNFDDFLKAFLISVQMQTTENWNNIVSLSVRPYVQRYVNGREPETSGIVLNSFFTSQILIVAFVLVGVVTAVAFDKLSEVRKVEEDSQQRSEQREEERKQRVMQINAVKNPNQPYIHRRTLRRAIQFYSSIPTEAFKTVETQRTEWSRSLSSPAGEVGGAIGKSLLKKMKSFRLTSTSEVDLHKKADEAELSSPVPIQHEGPSTVDVSVVTLNRSQSELVRTDKKSTGEANEQCCASSVSAITDSVSFDVNKTQPAPLLRECSLEDIRPVQSHETSPVFTDGSDEEQTVLGVRAVRNNPQQNSKQFGDHQVGFMENVKKIVLWLKEYVGTFYLNPMMEPTEMPNHSAFFLLSVDNRLRQICFKIVRHKSFDTIALFIVLFACGSLMLELPLPLRTSNDYSNGFCSIQPVLVYVDLAIAVFFAIEIGLKMTAYGIILHRGSYLRGVFNIVDVVVTVCSFVPIFVYFIQHKETEICVPYGFSNALSQQVSTLKVARVFRTLRFLRITSLYLVVSGMLVSLKKVMFIVIFNLLILIIFAVIGTHIFKGRFHHCTDPSKTTEEECRGMFFTYETGDLSCPTLNTREWRNYAINFDNIMISFMTVFVLLTKEGWPDIMYRGINGVPLNNYEPRGPQPFATKEASLYFVVFMIFVASFLLSLFSGFVIVVFQEVGFKSFRQAKLDRNQRNCIYYALTARPKLIYTPRYGVYKKVYERMVWIASHSVFRLVIIFAILLNSIILAVQYNVKDMDRCRVVDWINFGFTIFFGLEMMFKLAAFTPAIFFRSAWNAFECLIVIGSIVELIVHGAISKECSVTHVASAFRVLRLLQLIPSIHPILWTLVQTLQIFPWVGVLLAGLYVVYALLGMQAFGTIKVASPDESTNIMKYNNFGNFLQALLVMIRVSTGENWEEVMISCTSLEAECDPRAPRNSSCGSDFAYVFFSTFLFLSSMMIVSLFVAIMIDNFDYLVRDKSKLGPLALRKFVKLWSKYDPLATGTIHHEDLLKILTSCNPPVGWGKLCPLQTQYKKMFELNVSMDGDGMVKFNSTLFALVRSSLDIGCKGNNEELKGRLAQLFPTLQHKLDEVLQKDTHDTTPKTVGPLYAAKFVQHLWRNYFLRKRKQARVVRFKAGLRVQPNAGPSLLSRIPSDECLVHTVNSKRVVEKRASDNTNSSPRRPSTLHGLPSVAEEIELTDQTSQQSASHSDDLSYTSAPATPIERRSLTALSADVYSHETSL